MALELVLDADAHNALDDGIKPLYIAQEDGNYKLDANIPDNNAEGLKAKADELLGETKKEREKRKAAENELAEIKAERERIADEKAKADGDLEAIEKSWQSKLDEKSETYNGKIKALENQIYELTVGQTATTIASELALTGSANVLLPHIQNRLSLETTDDGEQKIRVLDASGNKTAMTLDDLKTEFRGNDAFKPLIAGNAGSGGGANGANGSAGKTTLKRSTMSNSDMAAYIKENGREAYLKLPK